MPVALSTTPPGPPRRLLIGSLLLALLPALLWLDLQAARVAAALRHLPAAHALAQRNPALDEVALVARRAAQAAAAGRRHRPRQHYLPYAQLAKPLVHAALLAEDGAFYLHEGVDLEGLRHAVRANLRAGRYAAGGSTITQQLARTLFLSPEKRLARKAAELLLATYLEQVLSKRRILELYLNYIEWGDGLYGCEAAARAAFGASCRDLDVEQAIRLATIIINPRRYGPFDPAPRLIARRAWLARRLFDEGLISASQYGALPFGPPLEQPPDSPPDEDASSAAP